MCLYILQFLLVDLRCHGDSSSIKKQGPHTVAAAALDVLKLVCISYFSLSTLLDWTNYEVWSTFHPMVCRGTNHP